MALSLRLHGDPPEASSRPRLAISAKGFRLFFALAGVYAIFVVPLWLAVIGGAARSPAYLDPPTWHAHEMIFGFTTAVIAGFLLTAVANWTQRETAIGMPLLGLAGVWVMGRGAMLFASSLPPGVTALVDLAFLPLLIGILARPIVAAKNWRNFVMLVVLALLFAANAAVHLDAAGILPASSARRASFVAIDLIALVILVIAGRVFPMFTRNATGATNIRSSAHLDVAVVVGMAVLVAFDAFAADSMLPRGAAGVVAVLAAARALHWGAQHSLPHPLLWILHAGYAWLVIGLVLRAAGPYFPGVSSSVGMHAVTVGAIGSLTLGMMVRVSLGHTGRALVVGPGARWAFAAITLSAAVRVAGPIVAPNRYDTSLIVAGVLWSIAFAMFLVVCMPILMKPRVDGKPG